MASDLHSELSSDEVVAESAETTTTTTTGAGPGTGAVPETGAIETKQVSDESAARADLNLVSDSGSYSGSGSVDSTVQASSEDSGGRGIPIWVALVGLVIAVLILGYQTRTNGQLEAEITGLEAELARTEAVLDAHKTHLGDIRGGVRDLSAQLQSLQTLVDTEPVTARDASTAAQP